MTLDRMSERIIIGEDAAYSKIHHNGQWVGIYEWHRCPANEVPGLHGDGLTPGWIQFTAPDAPPPSWELLQEEPLTLGGSLLCRACGRHGWIQEGRWVPA
jgi:hypothetical protein